MTVRSAKITKVFWPHIPIDCVRFLVPRQRQPGKADHVEFPGGDDSPESAVTAVARAIFFLRGPNTLAPPCLWAFSPTVAEFEAKSCSTK